MTRCRHWRRPQTPAMPLEHPSCGSACPESARRDPGRWLARRNHSRRSQTGRPAHPNRRRRSEPRPPPPSATLPSPAGPTRRSAGAAAQTAQSPRRASPHSAPPRRPARHSACPAHPASCHPHLATREPAGALPWTAKHPTSEARVPRPRETGPRPTQMEGARTTGGGAWPGGSAAAESEGDRPWPATSQCKQREAATRNGAQATACRRPSNVAPQGRKEGLAAVRR
mmetsp:Transcript_128251/g.410949  ORF Transcript_128251/g.410949 Transcript_128251/m.410949 type:complete len:227 (-) Transcript_128251:3-683(-)